jgi:hypothetical protein
MTVEEPTVKTPPLALQLLFATEETEHPAPPAEALRPVRPGAFAAWAARRTAPPAADGSTNRRTGPAPARLPAGRPEPAR